MDSAPLFGGSVHTKKVATAGAAFKRYLGGNDKRTWLAPRTIVFAKFTKHTSLGEPVPECARMLQLLILSLPTTVLLLLKKEKSRVNQIFDINISDFGNLKQTFQ